MLHFACTATGNDGDAQVVRQFGERLVGISGLYAVMIHAGEKDFAGTALLCFLGPFEETAFCWNAPAVQVALPFSVFKFGIDGDNTYLRAEADGNVFNELWILYRSRIHADLVGTCMKHALNVI